MSDEKAIRDLIARQFTSLQWSAAQPADWAAFASDFLPCATLFPSARPVAPKSVDAFVERMKGLSQTSLPKLEERLLGADIRIFGNVAVALAVCQITENGDKTSRNVEALLLIKDTDGWKIAAQGWDAETSAKPIPSALLEDA